ncbi:hypothetical protein PTI98_007148 [Pleurotus ostreatus]|nr:hypothetical protein PTI98_007148 [Pleurotus ostreatus]
MADARQELLDTNTYLEMRTKFLGTNPIFLVTFLLTASLQLLSGLSLKKTGDVLKSIKTILSLGVDADHQRMAKELLIDPRTVDSAMPYLSPPFRAYATCPACYAIYKIRQGKPNKDNDGEDDFAFPEKCTFRGTPDAEACGQRLRSAKSTKPDRSFLYHDFKHWLGWMFCRPDIAAALEQFPLGDDGPSDPMSDIWDGTMLRDFKGPESLGDGRFMVRLHNERRLIFSFNFDALNPGGSRQAVK